MSKIAVLYFVPEDDDSEKNPNVFYVSPRSQKLTLGEVKAAFPLPGRYHFRFRRSFKSTYVWQDVVNDSDTIPNEPFAKVSRISDTNVPIQKKEVRKPVKTEKKVNQEQAKRLEKKSSGDLLGLSVPHVDAVRTSPVSQSAPNNFMDLDWTQSPPLERSSTPPILAPSKTHQALNPRRNTQPLKIPGAKAKPSNVSMGLADDLSSAAKDFKL